MIELLCLDERHENLTRLFRILLILDWVPLGNGRLQICTVRLFIDFHVGALILVHNAAANVVPIVGPNKLLIDVIYIKYERRQRLATDIIDLELQNLVVHWIAIVLDDLTLHDSLFHST